MPARTEGALTALHDRNRKEVLDEIRADPNISRTALAQRVHLSRATVSAIVGELVQAGLLEESGQGPSTGGRPPIELHYRPDRRLAAGVVMTNGQVQAALTDIEGNLLASLELPVPAPTPQAMLQSMHEAITRLLQGRDRRLVLGIGVGTPGIVDLPHGILRIATSQGWLGESTPVKAYLEERLGLPVYVANRSRVAALGELKVGVGRGLSSLIYLFLGQGIVAGVVNDGQLYMGSTFGAGEIGHVAIVPDGPLCDCGNRGCLEVYASQAAILARAREMGRERPHSLLSSAVAGSLELLTIDQVLEAARLGDAPAKAVLSEAGSKVGMAVALLINLFDPDMVVIGGPLGCQAGNLLLEPIIEEARRRASARLFSHTEVVSGTMGLSAMALGAAVLAVSQTPVERFFAS